MVDVDRRRFLQITGGATALTVLEQSIARAAAIPAHRGSGTLRDVEHVVVLMQENRSFEHYLGSLRGVRGFGDPHPAVLPNGKSVWHQPDGAGEVLPFHPTVDDLGAAFLEGLPHAWPDGQAALNAGRYDGWVPAKGSTTMAYLERQDAAFHYALADTFTVCDAYYCSFIGNTDPNRYYLWTGWTGNDGKGGGPVMFNDELGYDWTTYPERLERAGVSWKVYQDEGVGLDGPGFWGWTEDPYIGNYGDNSLLYFNTYRNAAPGSPLHEKARSGTKARDGQDYFEVLKADVLGGTLPSVSWIAAPEAFSEHSNWPTNYGAWYIAQVLDALTANPEVWSKTIFLITYDENDGFFDHLVPPHAPSPVIPGRSTVPTDNEFYDGQFGPGSYGLGPRVPMFVISPWSTGGYVCSETFDHTSVIRLLEKRFGVREPNITPWRRAVCGDLTSAFDFSRARQAAPTLPDTSAFAPADRDRHPTYFPDPPATGSMPRQERGTRPARAIGYDFAAEENPRPDRVEVTLRNEGRLGVHVQARLLAPEGAPHAYTVGAGDRLVASWPVQGHYDVHLHGPNGFFRRYAGTAGKDPVTLTFDRIGRTTRLRVSVRGARTTEVDLVSAYGGHYRVRGGRSVDVDTAKAAGWYDLAATVAGSSWTRVAAGHLESGHSSSSDPALGR